MSLAVDLTRDLDLLDRLKQRLASVGVHAEIREYLMSLVVFPPAPALPICVFVSTNGRFYSWDGGGREQSVTNVAKAADELALIAEHNSCQKPADVGSAGK